MILIYIIYHFRRKQTTKVGIVADKVTRDRRTDAKTFHQRLNFHLLYRTEPVEDYWSSYIIDRLHFRIHWSQNRVCCFLVKRKRAVEHSASTEMTPNHVIISCDIWNSLKLRGRVNIWIWFIYWHILWWLKAKTVPRQVRSCCLAEGASREHGLIWALWASLTRSCSFFLLLYIIMQRKTFANESVNICS